MVNQNAIKPRVFQAHQNVVSVTTGNLFWFVFVSAIFVTNPAHFASSATSGDEPKSATQWLTGKELDRSLHLAVSGELSGATLREHLMDFARRRRTAIFLDRRVDPSIQLNLTLIDSTFEQFLWKVADENELGVCRVGNVFYMGPQRSADSLPVLLNHLNKKSSSRRQRGEGPKWRSKNSLNWPELSEPKQLLDKLGQENKFQITNPELIPHDVWPEVDLPELTLQQRLALLLVGFQLWFEPSGKDEIKLVNWPNVENGSRIVKNVKEPAKVARELGKELDNCKFVGSGRSLKMSGPIETMSRAVRLLVERQQPQKGDPTLNRFSLDTTAARKSILETIARQLGYQFEFDPDLKPVMEERITIKMSQQPIDAIVKEVLKGTTALYKIENGRLSLANRK